MTILLVVVVLLLLLIGGGVGLLLKSNFEGTTVGNGKYLKKNDSLILFLFLFQLTVMLDRGELGRIATCPLVSFVE